MSMVSFSNFKDEIILEDIRILKIHTALRLRKLFLVQFFRIHFVNNARRFEIIS